VVQNRPVFDDLLEANRRYQDNGHEPKEDGTARKGLAVLTCIDTRLDPLAALGLRTGDAKILRNAGARVTDDVLRSLVLAVNLLGVDRVAIVQHTECAVIGSTDDDLRARVTAAGGVDAAGWEFLAGPDGVAALRADVERLRACPLLPDDLEIEGFVFDVRTGALSPLDGAD
jgi:carbonic anhydrase